MPRVRDTVLLSGWLFADLLLALTVLFLVANTGGIKLAPVAPPTLTVDPTILDATDTAHCSGGVVNPQCTLTISELAASKGNITWKVTSDISDAIRYSTSNGVLSPGQSVKVTISAIPCQNGSFTFAAVRPDDNIAAPPVVVLWHCVPKPVKPERLDFNYQRFTLTVNDVNAFLADDPQQINDMKRQVMSQQILQGRNVGLAIVYGGTPDIDHIGQAQDMANKVYRLLNNLGQGGFAPFSRSSYYVPLYTLGPAQSRVDVDVYFFTT